MSTAENNGYQHPREGDRLGGTLAEGRLTQRNTPASRLHGKRDSSTPPPSPIIPARNSSKGIDKEIHPSKKDVDRPVGYVRGLEALHFDHKVWLNSLRFYREELFIFQRHLEQYVRTSAVQETMAHVEQYQNRLIRQSEVIDELAHDIKQHDQALSAQLDTDPSAVLYRPFGIHNELRERMEVFERLYTELKNEFRSWLAYHR